MFLYPTLVPLVRPVEWVIRAMVYPVSLRREDDDLMDTLEVITELYEHVDDLSCPIEQFALQSYEREDGKCDSAGAWSFPAFPRFQAVTTDSAFVQSHVSVRASTGRNNRGAA